MKKRPATRQRDTNLRALAAVQAATVDRETCAYCEYFDGGGLNRVLRARRTGREVDARKTPEPRQTGKVSLDDLFPGFDAEAFIRSCAARGVSFADAKAALFRPSAEMTQCLFAERLDAGCSRVYNDQHVHGHHGSQGCETEIRAACP